MSLVGELNMYLRFARDLRKFLKETVTVEQARKVVKERLENREQNLLAVVKRAVYDNENSPYLKLLELAGCEYGDFERMVNSDGIEPTLKKLCQEGVYISIEEFKGKKEVTRGDKVFNFKPSDFDNPFSVAHLQTRSSGSRSAGTRTMYDFDYIKENYVEEDIAIMAHFIAERGLLEQRFPKAKILSSDGDAEGVDLHRVAKLIVYSMSFKTSKYTQRLARQANHDRKEPIEVDILVADKPGIGFEVYKSVAVKKENFDKNSYERIWQ